MEFCLNYIYIAFITLQIICLVRGYNGSNYKKTDIIDSLFWPLTYSVLLGIIAKIISSVISEKIKIKGRKWQKK